MNEDRSAEGEGPSEIDKILEQARGAKTGKEMAEAYNRFDKWAIGSPDTPFGEKAAYRAQLDARSAGIPPDGTPSMRHAFLENSVWSQESQQFLIP